MVSMHIFQKIRLGVSQGKSLSELARELGKSRSTISKYAKSNSPPRYKEREGATRIDEFAPYLDEVKKLLERTPKVSATEVYEWLVERGFGGSERTVQRRLKSFKDAAPKERFFEQHYEPGEQAQFDFKESVSLPFAAGIREVHLHISTLPFSNLCVAKAYPQKNYECFMDGVQSFFEEIGGMPKNIRFDNLSPVVVKIYPDGRRKYTQAFSKAHEHYGFGLLPCSPGRGNEKGDVERDIQTFSRRFLNHTKMENLIFRDFENLNEVLRAFLKKREKAETQKLFFEESNHLRPLPLRDENILCRSESLRAGEYGTIRILKSTYSVPDEVIGRECWVVPGPYEVRIYLQASRRLVATHPRQPDGSHSVVLEHVLRSLLRKPRAMVRWAHREILFPDPVLATFYEKLKSQNELGAEREFLKTINLVQQISFGEIVAAVSLVLETTEISFDSVKDLLFTERRPSNVIDLCHRFEQVPISPDLQVYNQLIPK